MASAGKTSRNTFYEKFSLSKVPRAQLSKELLANLFIPPKKAKGPKPRIRIWKANAVQQADLLRLPEDNEYKYALVCVDLGTRIVDAEPLKFKNSDDVLKAFKKIYKRGRLKPPSIRLEVDSGTEFKSSVREYFTKKIKCTVKVGQPGRHRQQAYAECANKQLETALLMRMVAQELLTGTPSREWVEDLNIMVDALNENWKRDPPKRPEGLPVCSGESCNLLSEGTRVRILLDEPRSVLDEKLHGNFRAGDIRWSPEIHVIKQVLLYPEQPPMYLVDGPHGNLKVSRASYTREQLQVVPEDENLPPPSVIRGNPMYYKVEKILAKRFRNKKTQYLVKWQGFPITKATWESGEKLEEDVPELVRAYNDT